MSVWWVFNEGGRFLTLSIYRHPCKVRLYLGWDWTPRGPRRAWVWP